MIQKALFPSPCLMPILWKRLASGFAVSALFVAFARSLGFDWVPALSFVALYALILFARTRYPKASQDAGHGKALRDVNERKVGDKAADL
jgi:hypothetical protein